MKRIFRDAPQDKRCKATIVLSDKSTAQCGRYAKVEGLCKQHASKQTIPEYPSANDLISGLCRLGVL